MLAENPSRINFYEKYQEIIKANNQEQNRATIEKTFKELMHLSQSLSEREFGLRDNTIVKYCLVL